MQQMLRIYFWKSRKVYFIFAPMRQPKRITKSLKISEGVHQALRVFVVTNNRDMTDVADSAIEKYLESQNKKVKSKTK